MMDLEEVTNMGAELHSLETGTEQLTLLRTMLQQRDREVDIYEDLGLSHSELFHSSILAWLLRPRGSHGLGDRFLVSFLTGLYGRNHSLLKVDRPGTTVGREEHLEHEGQTGRLDVLLMNESARYLCAIENKVWAPEAEDQLGWYRRALKHHYPDYDRRLVFLTPDGRDSDDRAEQGRWTRMSYQQVLGLVEGLLAIQPPPSNADVRAVLRQYAITLRRNIVPEVSNDIHKLARLVYLKHRRAIDLIADNRDQYRPNYVTEGFRMIREAVGQQPLWQEGTTNRPYVRFRAATWEGYADELRLDGWPHSLLLFEVQVTESWARLNLTLFEGGDESLRRKLFDRVRERGDIFQGNATAYTDQMMVLHRDKDILLETDYDEWWDEKTTRDRVRSRLAALAEGSFTEINRIVEEVLEEYRSARG